MAIREVVQIGHPALKASNKSISKVNNPKIIQIVEDLKDTMRKSELVGIAAPQIAENYKVFITEIRQTKSRPAAHTDELRVFINPIIKKLSREKCIIYEGCGSVVKGQIFGPVARPKRVTVEATNEKGERFELTCDGLLGRVIQHENDHLNGIEFLEKISDYKKIINDEYYRENIKNSKEQVENSKVTLKKYRLIKS